MLEEVHVRDLALIDEAWLELGPGLNVLSGETGAGKTVLVEALQLLVGERADSTLVRSGASEALVEGRFRTPSGEILARRRLSAEGRSRCYLDGELATVGGLAEALGALVDLHGQHDHQALLTPSSHVGYLDRFAGEQAADSLRAYREGRRALHEAHVERRALEETLSGREERRETLAFISTEIESTAPEPGEDEALEARLPRLRHAERLTHAASTAWTALRGDDAASDRLGDALSVLEGVNALDGPLDDIAIALESALTDIDDVGARLREYGDSIEHDPRALEAAEVRGASLAALKKKYGPTLDDVIATKERADEELASLETCEEDVARLRAAEDRAGTQVRSAGLALSKVRADAIERFAAELESVTGRLAMEDASFEVGLDELPFESWTDDGPHHVQIRFLPSAGEEPRPLAKVASGGEISRVMLALKTVLGQADATPVLVFDEIDAGVGGASAVAVGKTLSDLARSHQVIVVTHLAQVAAFADRHLVVSKEERQGRTVTVVRPADGDERIAELARMLSGSGSETGMAHARELLDVAARV